MSRTVLIVDDSPDLRALISQVLEMEGFDVRTAADGALAINSLSTHLPPNLIVLDSEMPNMNGETFLSELAKMDSAEVRNIPVVMLSAIEGIKNDRISAFIKKPFELDEVLNTVSLYCPQSSVQN